MEVRVSANVNDSVNDSDNSSDSTYAPNSSEFDDLLAANREYAKDYQGGFDGIAHAGVCLLTCMDSRIDPLRMLGLKAGDAKVLRNPGGRVTTAAMSAIVVAVHLLNVRRVMVVPHTRCAMAGQTEQQLRERIEAASGQSLHGFTFGPVEDQLATLADDVRRVRGHALIPTTVVVGGFLYDVDTGLLDRRC